MAIPSGSYRVSVNHIETTLRQPKPTSLSNRNSIRLLVDNTLSRIANDTVITFNDITRLDGNLVKIYFTPAALSIGKLQPSNIKENYLYINGVYIKKRHYRVYEEDTSLVVELVNDLGYRIEQSYDIKLRIRTSI